MNEPTLHTPPTSEPDRSGPAFNATRIATLLRDGCGTIDLSRTTADGGTLVVGRARCCRDERFDVMVLHPTQNRIAGYAKSVNALTWSVWMADGHWVGYASTLAYGADILSHGIPAANTNRMHRGSLTYEHRET